ncbi:hypothetical protein RIF29_18420 [Crotalaria pallida]|uniref:Uncharacterized protein n=1 Tax=Crotalaria pallida TaxID=3830 RepID=A0AAN9IG67_CROPI
MFLNATSVVADYIVIEVVVTDGVILWTDSKLAFLEVPEFGKISLNSETFVFSKNQVVADVEHVYLINNVVSGDSGLVECSSNRLICITKPCAVSHQMVSVARLAMQDVGLLSFDGHKSPYYGAAPWMTLGFSEVEIWNLSLCRIAATVIAVLYATIKCSTMSFQEWPSPASLLFAVVAG